MTDRELAGEIYEVEARLLLGDGVTDDKVLQTMIEEMRKTTKVQREIKIAELKASGWKP